MLYSTRTRLIASFLGVSFLVGAVSLVIGGLILYRAVLSEANNRITLNLNSAREIYRMHIKSIKCPLTTTAREPAFQDALYQKDIPEICKRLQTAADIAELDFAGIVYRDGITLCTIGNKVLNTGNVMLDNPLVDQVRHSKVPVSGTVILDTNVLRAHSPELAERARIPLIPTPRAAPRPEKEETSGMALATAVPVMKNGLMAGIVYGGVLLNRSTGIVDTVRDTVFQNEVYKGRSIGTATIFFNDLRISTNVLTPEGRRAIGTRVSREVKERVLADGKKWEDRAFVVSDWYMTAYEPITDIFNQRVGILYVGVLEEKYIDIRRKALSVFILLTAAGMVTAIVLGYLLADKMLLPVNRLISASKQVSEGDFAPEIGPISKTELGVLQSTFKDMLVSLKEREQKRRRENEYRLLQSEKQASIGRLAAGVAHEINNPLTGVLTYTHMLLRRKDIDNQMRSDLQTIASSTERVRKIVKGLLDFSRQTKLEREPVQVNRLIKSTVALIENQALLKGVGIEFNAGENLPTITPDRDQFQSVLMNILINALDASETGGMITIGSAVSVTGGHEGQKGVEISITDNGCGIPSENLDKLFDPFFTTKDVGRGTGLGLAVSYGIIERHGGTIRVQSEPGKGTTFYIWLPTEGEHE